MLFIERVALKSLSQKLFSCLHHSDRHRRQPTFVAVSVDMMPPVKGVVKDHKDPNEDEMHSSEASTVASTWRQFADPESGLKSYLVNICRKPSGKYIMLYFMIAHLLCLLTSNEESSSVI